MRKPEPEYPGDLRPLHHDIADARRRRAQALADVHARLQRVRDDVAGILREIDERSGQRRREIRSSADALARRLADARARRLAALASLRADIAAARDQSRRRLAESLTEASSRVRADVALIRRRVAAAKALRFRTGSFAKEAVSVAPVPARPPAPARQPVPRKARRAEGRNFLDSISY